MVKHIAITCTASFEAVRDAITAAVPKLDPTLPATLEQADGVAIAKERAHGHKLWLFETRDHGALVEAEGRRSKALQFEIGT